MIPGRRKTQAAADSEEVRLEKGSELVCLAKIVHVFNLIWRPCKRGWLVFKRSFHDFPGTPTYGMKLDAKKGNRTAGIAMQL